MRRTFVLITTFLMAYTAYGQQLNRTFTQQNGAVHYLGEIRPEALQEAPFATWYDTMYEAGVPQKKLVRQLRKQIGAVDSITLFMGTWCGDSRREVPRLFRILEEINYDMSRLKVICVSSQINTYKQSPDREEAGLNIHRVPTVLLHDTAGAELNRIVESPVTSLEEDLLAILEPDSSYTPNYKVANALYSLLEEKSLLWLSSKRDSLTEVYAAQVSSPYELNTFALTVYTTQRAARAAWVWELNLAMHPNLALSRYWLSRAYLSMGKEPEALAEMREVALAYPDNEGIARFITDLSQRLGE